MIFPVCYSGVAYFYIDTIENKYLADVYGSGRGAISAELVSGTHTLYIPFNGFEGTGFGCTLVPAAQYQTESAQSLVVCYFWGVVSLSLPLSLARARDLAPFVN